MHEQSLASAKPAACEDIVEDGEIGFREACRLNCVQGLWNRQAKRRSGKRVFSVTAGAQERANLLTNLRSADALTLRNNFSRDFQARNIRLDRGRGGKRPPAAGSRGD